MSCFLSPGEPETRAKVCCLVQESLVLPGAAAAPGEAVHHLRDGHHAHQRRLLRSVLPPGCPRPPGWFLPVPGRLCHVGRWYIGHLWTHRLRLVLGPASVEAHPCAEPVGHAGGGLHHPAARQLPEWVLPRSDADQRSVRLLLRGYDLRGLRRGARYCGSQAHDGCAGAADAHRERGGTAGHASVR